MRYNKHNYIAGAFQTPFRTSGDKANTTTVYVEGCTNYGVIKGVTYVGGIAARVGRAAQSPKGNYRIANCVNYGEIKAAAVKDASIYAAGETVAAYAGDPAAIPNSDTVAVTFTAEQLAAGEIAYLKEIGFQLK